MPCIIRWPGVLKPGTVINEVGAHEDMMPTLVAAAGEPGVKEKLLKGHTAINRDYKVHLDGYNLLPALKGEAPWPRKEFLYWTDDGGVAALRYGNWKMTFMVQRARGMDVWFEPFVALRAPILINLRMDPFERAREEGIDYPRWSRRAHVRGGSRRDVRGPVAAELPRVPAEAEAGELQPRQGHGRGDERPTVEVAIGHRTGGAR